MDSPQHPPPADQPIIDITAEPSRGGYETGSHVAAIDAVLRRRRRAFVGLTALLSVLAGVWYWTLPKVYEATSTILLTRLGQMPGAIADSEIGSEIELVWSQASGLGQPPPATGGLSVQAAEARKTEILKHVGVRQLPKSQVLSLSYTDPSAKYATDQANLLAGLYLKQRHRLLDSPTHLVSVEAEAVTLNGQADEAAKELAEFDVKALGGPYRIKSDRLAAIEDRAFELRASIRGQEEVVKALRKTSAIPDAVQSEAQLAGMRAKLQEMQKEFARLEMLETQAGSLSAKREQLARRAALAQERAEVLNRRLQQARIDGMSLQARLLSLAEAKQVRAANYEWWHFILMALGILAIAWIGAWAIDLFDRPVYSDDDLANMTGAPTVETASDY